MKQLLSFVATAHPIGFRRSLSTSRSMIKGTIPKYGKDIATGQQASVERTFTQNDVNAFSHLVNDDNPIHAQGLVQGVLSGSMFSCIFGTLIPKCVYKRQDLDFVQPVYANQPVVARIKVLKVKELEQKGSVVICETRVTDPLGETVFVLGKATVWIPRDISTSSA